METSVQQTLPLDHNLKVEEKKALDLPLIQISLDSKSFVRAGVDHAYVSELAQLIIDGRKEKNIFCLPPITVRKDGSLYPVVDGIHRFLAAQQAKETVIPVIVLDGDSRKGFLFAVGANSAHGLRLTSADKNHIVNNMLLDDEWSKWSNVQIAMFAGVSRRFVDKISNALKKSGEVTKSAVVQIKRKDGTLDYTTNFKQAYHETKKIEAEKIESIVPQKDLLGKILTEAMVGFTNDTESTRRPFVKKLRADLDALLKGLNPFEVKEDKKEEKKAA